MATKTITCSYLYKSSPLLLVQVDLVEDRITLRNVAGEHPPALVACDFYVENSRPSGGNFNRFLQRQATPIIVRTRVLIVTDVINDSPRFLSCFDFLPSLTMAFVPFLFGPFYQFTNNSKHSAISRDKAEQYETFTNTRRSSIVALGAFVFGRIHCLYSKQSWVDQESNRGESFHPSTAIMLF